LKNINALILNNKLQKNSNEIDKLNKTNEDSSKIVPITISDNDISKIGNTDRKESNKILDNSSNDAISSFVDQIKTNNESNNSIYNFPKQSQNDHINKINSLIIDINKVTPKQNGNIFNDN
jgi:hypothetical protein